MVAAKDSPNEYGSATKRARVLENLKEDDLSFADLNTTELRTLCRHIHPKTVSSWACREDLIAFLAGDKALPQDPTDEVRTHHMEALVNRWSHYSHCLSCNADCFQHTDIQLLECQVNNPALQHHKLKQEV